MILALLLAAGQVVGVLELGADVLDRDLRPAVRPSGSPPGTTGHPTGATS